MSLKQIYIVAILALLNFSCTNSNQDTESKIDIIGTWELLSHETIKGDSVTRLNMDNQKLIKMFNDTHFSFFRHDLHPNQDSTLVKEKVFVSGGGRYKLDGHAYTEFLEFCNYRSWENNQFDFSLEMKGDTLIQTGREKIVELNIDQEIVEKYIRTNS